MTFFIYKPTENNILEYESDISKDRCEWLYACYSNKNEEDGSYRGCIMMTFDEDFSIKEAKTEGALYIVEMLAKLNNIDIIVE